MKTAVSIVVPALGPGAHLQHSLEALHTALAGRGACDELLLVDDSGAGALERWAAEHCPAARVLARDANGGFGRALHSGIAAAANELVFCMNSDLAPRAGFLEPLIAALDDRQVFAAGPRVLRAGGSPAQVESLARVELLRGRVRVSQPCLEDPARALPADLFERTRSVPFALGGACLLRRADYFALGALDPIFEPFYLEDVDLCWRAWRAGRRCVLVPASEVVHTNQATIGSVAPRELVEAAIAKNHWLFEWKHLDQDLLAEHMAALELHLSDAWLHEDRAALEVLALALEQSARALEGRAVARDGLSFAALARASDPLEY